MAGGLLLGTVEELTAGEEPTAYPVRFLHYHEIVNATHDGRPVAVTWCPLCGSAVVYDRTVDGRVLEFGVSGKLADDDLVMYDRETGSEWKQSLGECIAGPLEGHELTVLPAAMTTYGRFASDWRVLQPPGGRSEAASDTDEPADIDYYDAAPYERYFETDGFGLDAHRGSGGREWDREDISPKAVVLGVEVNGAALGFPLPRVQEAGGVGRAAVGGERVVVFVNSHYHVSVAVSAKGFVSNRNTPRLAGVLTAGRGSDSGGGPVGTRKWAV